jgi:hypothetical protein
MRTAQILCAAGLVASCGVVGPPVPPENVGVTVTIENQKKQEEAAKKRLEEEARSAAEGQEVHPLLQGQDDNLPPLRPVGTR